MAGYYCLKIYGKCGGSICDSCKICFYVTCDTVDCCKGGSWINKYYGVSNPLIKTAPVPIECGKEYQVNELDNGSITFNADYACATNQANCTKQVYVKVMKGSTVIAYQPVSYSMPLSTPGNFTITYYAKCGDKICDSCTYFINILQDCCKGSHWDKIAWKGFPNLSCNTSISTAIPVNTVEIVNYKFICAQGCKADIRYDIKNSSGTVVSSVTGASGTDQKITLPGSSGQYCLIAYGLCNQKVCDSCSICFSTTCVNCTNVKINDIANPTALGSYFDINGTIASPTSIAKVTAQLVSFSADNFPVSPLYTPVPNFEFALQPLGMSTIGGVNILIPFSLTGTRSNIAVSNSSTLGTSVLFNFKIDNYKYKRVRHYRIKFTMLFTDGTYCEQEIIKNY